MRQIVFLLCWVGSLSTAAQTWSLVWSDEFNRDGKPDEAIWNFEEGFVRNEEAQWYQAANAWQEDGLLIIEARRQRRPNPTYRPDSRHWGRSRPTIDYTSACLTTQGKREFLFRTSWLTWRGAMTAVTRLSGAAGRCRLPTLRGAMQVGHSDSMCGVWTGTNRPSGSI